MKKLNHRRILLTAFWLVLLSTTSVFVVSAVQRKKSEDLDKIIITLIAPKGAEHMMTKDDIRKVLKKKYQQQMMGISLKAIQPEQIEAVLSAMPYVEKAEVFVDATQSLNVRIRERQPLLRVMDNSGADYYLDKTGVRMPVASTYTPRIMVVTGDVRPYKAGFMEKEEEPLKELIGLAQDIKKDPFMDALIEQVFVDSIGDFILIPKLGNQKIILGDRTDIEEKFKKLSVFYKEGISREGWQKYKTINLKYRDQVVCQLNEAFKA